MPKEFTRDELKGFDGKNGKSAYFACNGTVYDVSDSTQWTGGDHFGMHTAGIDLTDELGASPHGPEVFEFFKKAGVLKD